MNTAQVMPKLTLSRILWCGAAIVTLTMGIRHGFGLWLQPLTMERGWTRETFAFAMAIQNLVWGLAGPFAGMLADRFGASKVIMGGALLYGLGLLGMATSTAPSTFILTTGVLIGLAQSATTYAVVYGVIGRNVAPERRSWAMGTAAAAGSFGQFLMVPMDSWLIQSQGWQAALTLLAMSTLIILPLAWALKEPHFDKSPGQGPRQSILAAAREAWHLRDFKFLMLGYFVCGFQVVFIGVHMPSYLRDHQLGPEVATIALGLIGLFNVVGTYAAGVLGQHLPKRYILSAIYGLRSLVIVVFLLAPLTPLSVYVFSAVMGVLWLSTVPPTNAIVAQIFGVQHLSMLGGVVFLAHQIGSFLGVWLGGWIYDRQGNYDTVWMLAVGLGLMGFLINLPIRETAIQRPSLA